MMIKFYPSTVIPTAEEVSQGFEGEKGNRVPAVTTDIVNYVKMVDLHDKDLNSFDVGTPVEMALREDGPVFVVNGDYVSADRFCQALHNELECDIEMLVEQYVEDGQIGVALADDVLEHIKAEAKKQMMAPAAATIEKSKEEAKMVNGYKGLSKGQVVQVGGLEMIIKGFAGEEAVVEINGKENNVPVQTILDVITKSNANNKEEVTMTKPSVSVEVENKTKGAVEAMVNNEGNKDSVVNSSLADKFLNATQVTTTEENVENQTKGGTNMELTLPSQKKEEVKVNNTNTKGETKVKKNNGPTVNISGSTKSTGRNDVKAPSALTDAEKALVVTDAAKENETGIHSFDGVVTPWYFVERYPNVVQSRDILEVNEAGRRGANPLLGIEEMKLFSMEDLIAEKKRSDKFTDAKKYPFVIQLFGMGRQLKASFDIELVTDPKKKYPVSAKTIAVTKLRDAMGNEYWGGEYRFYTQNKKEFTVKCADTVVEKDGKKVTRKGCGTWNDIEKIGEVQKCKKCGKRLKAEEKVVGGEDVSRVAKQRQLPFGFLFGEELLAQVMVFAHYALEQVIKHPDYKQQ